MLASPSSSSLTHNRVGIIEWSQLLKNNIPTVGACRYKFEMENKGVVDTLPGQGLKHSHHLVDVLVSTVASTVSTHERLGRCLLPTIPTRYKATHDNACGRDPNSFLIYGPHTSKSPELVQSMAPLRGTSGKSGPLLRDWKRGDSSWWHVCQEQKRKATNNWQLQKRTWVRSRVALGSNDRLRQLSNKGNASKIACRKRSRFRTNAEGSQAARADY